MLGVPNTNALRVSNVEEMMEVGSMISESPSTLEYNLSCCGVIIGGREELTEEDVRSHIGRKAEEVRLLSMKRMVGKKKV